MPRRERVSGHWAERFLDGDADVRRALRNDCDAFNRPVESVRVRIRTEREIGVIEPEEMADGQFQASRTVGMKEIVRPVPFEFLACIALLHDVHPRLRIFVEEKRTRVGPWRQAQLLPDHDLRVEQVAKIDAIQLKPL